MASQEHQKNTNTASWRFVDGSEVVGTQAADTGG